MRKHDVKRDELQSIAEHIASGARMDMALGRFDDLMVATSAASRSELRATLNDLLAQATRRMR